ncbi:MAG: M48 family metalloprotease [Burkholderiales bacterium]|jgi:Zn-dependent protease with chaperone function|nr:M48 family metalloprotease [Burkholderiales bacterium]
MDFFRHQREASRRSVIFIVLFSIVVVAIEAMVMWVARKTALFFQMQDPVPLVLTAGILAFCIILFGTLIRVNELRRNGGAAVAQSLGGELLEISHANEDDQLAFDVQKFRNVVGEMSVAARVPMPTLYWLPKEYGINAFVAGYTAADAVLCVTKGALTDLSRDELQGVVAHEFGHLLNGDMRLNTRVSGWLSGIYSLHTFGCKVFEYGFTGIPVNPKDDEDRFAHPYVMGISLIVSVAFIVIGSIGFFFGRLLQAAVSRQREYLADASAVQFTRQTKGLAGALKKIYYGTSMLSSPLSGEFNHFFLSNGGNAFFDFSTHPPLLSRISRLDKYFQAHRSVSQRVKKIAELENTYSSSSSKRVSIEPLAFETLGVLPKADIVQIGFDPAQSPKIDLSNRAALAHPVVVPGKISVYETIKFLFATLIGFSDEPTREKQYRAILDDGWEAKLILDIKALIPEVVSMPMFRRLMRLRLMMTYLHQLSAEQRQTLRQTLDALINADQSISLLEVAVELQVARYLSDIDRPAKSVPQRSVHYQQCTDAIELLARIVTENADRHAGEIVVDAVPGAAQILDEALNRLNRLTWHSKKRLFVSLFERCGENITPNQQEILSLFAVCLHAPPLALMIDAHSLEINADGLTIEEVDKNQDRFGKK